MLYSSVSQKFYSIKRKKKNGRGKKNENIKISAGDNYDVINQGCRDSKKSH